MRRPVTDDGRIRTQTRPEASPPHDDSPSASSRAASSSSSTISASPLTTTDQPVPVGRS